MHYNSHSVVNTLESKIKNIISCYQPGPSPGKPFPIIAYWIMGSSLAEAEDKLASGPVQWEAIIQQLANELEPVHGYRFGKAGLRKIYHFYHAFPDWYSEFAGLSWSHYTQLLRIGDEQKRRYYLEEALSNQWSIRALERQIKSSYFERQGITQKEKDSPTPLFQEPFVLEFLDLNNPTVFLERELESALLGKLQLFLLELGKGFAFVAQQKMITTTTGKRFYIDLVFYHFILKCFVLIDLKIGALTHGDIGQMDMYVRLYEEKWRQPSDNPTIGIILCPEKDETIVKYSILEESKQLFASRYQLYLPTKEELERERILNIE